MKWFNEAKATVLSAGMTALTCLPNYSSIEMDRYKILRERDLQMWVECGFH